MLKKLVRRLAWSGGAALAVYAMLLIYIFFGQEQMIFHKAPVAQDHDYGFGAQVSHHFLNRPDGARLHGVIHPARGERRGVVVYYKGNAGNVGNGRRMADTFTGMGFDVVAMDHRGYGKSRGDLSESAFLGDGLAWYDWARSRYPGEDVRVVGYSLGTTLAAHVVHKRDPGNVILFAPMRSVLHLGKARYPFVPDFISRFPLRSDLRLSENNDSILIYHGNQDRIIPPSSALALKPVLDDSDHFMMVAGATHASIPWEKAVLRDIHRRWGRTTEMAIAISD
ncbi:alpha/beta hydrolase [Yunchengibacter salinarum]|uniref:alpha/beta hydrolase n=1 Tax=Yunchengibacter salinarum TaxID=3133399 RepID=UPI0035B58BA2